MIETNTTRTSRLMLLGILLFLIFFFASIQFGSPPILKLFGVPKVNLMILFLSRLMHWVGLLLLWVYAIKVEKQGLLLWDNHSYKIPKLLLHILLLYITVMVLAVPVHLLISLFDAHQESSKLELIKDLLLQNKLMLPLLAVTAGVVEEYLFRGYIQPRLELLFKSPWAGILVTSILFGAMHYSYGTLTNVAIPFVIGLVFSIYYSKYRNIYALIICHTLIDLISLGSMMYNSHS